MRLERAGMLGGRDVGLVMLVEDFDRRVGSVRGEARITCFRAQALAFLAVTIVCVLDRY